MEKIEEHEPTKQNTEFMAWWKMLNEEMQKLRWGEVGLRDAKSAYESGDTPEDAAQALTRSWA
jgi:hypothetical protein